MAQLFIDGIGAKNRYQFGLQKTELKHQLQRLDLKQKVQQLVSEIYNNKQQYFALKNAIQYREKSYAIAKRKWELGMENFLNVQQGK